MCRTTDDSRRLVPNRHQQPVRRRNEDASAYTYGIGTDSGLYLRSDGHDVTSIELEVPRLEGLVPAPLGWLGTWFSVNGSCP